MNTYKSPWLQSCEDAVRGRDAGHRSRRGGDDLHQRRGGRRDRYLEDVRWHAHGGRDSNAGGERGKGR